MAIHATDEELDILEVQDQEDETELEGEEVAVPISEEAAHQALEEETELNKAIEKVEIPEEEAPIKAKPQVSIDLINRPLRLEELEDDGAL